MPAKFVVNQASGWLDGAKQVPSPNCDARPSGVEVDLLVIHGISLPPAQFGGPWIEALFTNNLDCERHPYFDNLRGVQVSAHVLVRRNGEIIQFVPFNKRAWHAGESVFEGRERCNDFSIGIELEGYDNVGYTTKQYDALVTLSQAVMAAYPRITLARIAGHNDISPQRKTDPGPAFDWTRYRVRLQHAQRQKV